MKKDRILNPQLLTAVATTGHTDYLVIADCGLPIPRGVEVIDVSVRVGLPRFMDVLKAIDSELVVESAIVASEIDEKNPQVWQEISDELRGLPIEKLPHEAFKEYTKRAKYIIRTGETSPYANVILIGGVNF